jgi:hypothetical protein
VVGLAGLVGLVEFLVLKGGLIGILDGFMHLWSSKERRGCKVGFAVSRS